MHDSRPQVGSVRCRSRSARDVQRRWADPATHVPSSGLWPVVIANDFPFSGFVALAQLIADADNSDSSPVADILRAAHALEIREVLASMWEQTLPLDDDNDEPRAFASWEESEPPLPSEIPVRLFPTAGDAVIALFSVAAREEIRAALGWGSWNACPSPEQHVAIPRY